IAGPGDIAVVVIVVDQVRIRNGCRHWKYRCGCGGIRLAQEAHEEPVVVVENVIDSGDVVVHHRGGRVVGDEIGTGGGTVSRIRSRIESPQPHADRVDKARWNLIVRESYARSRVLYGQTCAGEVSGQFRLGRNNQVHGILTDLPLAFVVEEEVSLVLFNRATDAAAKKVIAESRFGCRKKRIRVQNVVAEEFVGGAVKLVGSRFGG